LENAESSIKFGIGYRSNEANYVFHTTSLRLCPFMPFKISVDAEISISTTS